MPDPARSAAPVPVTLLTGFLGAGKTTLLNRILSERHGERIAVIVNEYGELGVDGSLVVGSTEELVELANGCVCCTVRGDLSRSLVSLLAARERRVFQQPFDRILIETSGLAAPGPIVQTLVVDPALVGRVRLDGIITLAHAANLLQQLDRHAEAADQLAYADRVLLNHADRCGPDQLQAARTAVRSRNALAELTDCVMGDTPLGPLLDIGTADPTRWDELMIQSSDVHEHNSDVGSVSLTTDAELDLHRLKIWLQFLANRRGQDLYRLKGVLRCHQQAHAVVVQGMYEWLELGPDERLAPKTSRLVLIGRELDRDELERGWAACRSELG